MGDKKAREEKDTDASNALNSCSFISLYSSISFCASERASFNLWIRSKACSSQVVWAGIVIDHLTDIDGPAAQSLLPLSLPLRGFGSLVTVGRPIVGFVMLIENLA